MADDDDDLGGGTLVMSPEERPPITGGAPAAAPRPAGAMPDPPMTEDSWDEDAPGTFIMHPTNHTGAPTPASPFADSKERGSWPMTQVVVGNAAPGLAHARTLMGGMEVVQQAEAIIAEREQQLQQQLQLQPMVPAEPFAFGAPQQPMGLGAQPQLGAPVQPMQGLPANEPFPPPGSAAFYGPDSSIEPQAKPGIGPLLLGAGVGLLTVTAVVGGYYGYRALTGPSAAPSSSTTSSSAPAAPGSVALPPATTGTPAPGGASSTPTTQPPAATGAEGEARAALEKLAAGIKNCVATTIGTLPGTSPPVPAALSWLKSGSYKPSLNDFESPVYHCARFKVDGPMRYLIQWQSEDVKGTKGSAIAWIDDNGDGVADRAFGFSATLPKRRVAEIGPIEAVDAKRAIKKR